MSSEKATPNYLWSMLTLKCPRCRRGKMFTHANPYKNISLKYIMDMPDQCAECRQKYDMERGFWYGTGYVSYGLTVALSVATFVAWWILIGISTHDNRIFWWLGTNGFLLVVLQPWLMRVSRTMYLYFFVSYDPDYENTEPRKFDS